MAKETEIVPVGTNVLVRRDQSETKTPSGLFIPDSGKKKPNTGTVVAIPQKEFINDRGVKVYILCDLEDRIVFQEYGATEIKRGQESLYLIDGAKDVLAVLR